MAYIGVDGKAREIAGVYIGVDGKAREVSKIYIGADNFAKRNLPSGYTQVEYIESSGTQYIDTGFKPNQDSKMVLDFYPTIAQSTCYAGTRKTTSSGGFMINSGSSNTLQYGVMGASGNVSLGAHAVGRHIVSIENGVFTYDGQSTAVSSSTIGTFTASYSVYLFACNQNGVNLASSCRIYSCKIYDNGTLVRDYVPCISPNNIVGLYDMANGVFYENKGSGVFVTGEVYKTNVARLAWEGVAKTETVEYTSAGTYSVTVPTWAKYAEITACAGGGGGGGGSSQTNASNRTSGGGGGGGGQAIQNALYTIQGGGTLSVTVGAGGSGGVSQNGSTSATAGSNGGNTIIGTIVTLTGGKGGNVGGKSSGGAGGASGGAGGGAGGSGGYTNSSYNYIEAKAGNAGIVGSGGARGSSLSGQNDYWDWINGGGGGGGGSLSYGGYGNGYSGSPGGGGGGGISKMYNYNDSNSINGGSGGNGYVKIIFKSKK